MATISITEQAPTTSSAYRPLIFKVESTVIAPELQIRGDLYARNDFNGAWVKVATKYEKKYLDLDYFIFNFSNILQTLLSFDRNILATPLHVTPNRGSLVQYYAIFTEIYYNSNGIPTPYETVTSSTCQAVNAIPQHEDTQVLTDYILPTDAT